MTGGDLARLAFTLDAEAARRFPRWSAATWLEVVEGPATELARGLGEDGSPLVDSYLRLACEGVGRGYLFPSARAAAENFFTMAFTRILPRELPQLPAERRPAVLAAAFNLGENLEASPVWLRRIFHRLVRRRDRLGDVEALVADVTREALEPPAAALGTGLHAVWVELTGEDPRFLPGTMHFLAPTVLCVHDRHRGRAAGRDAVTCGVWLAAGEPLPLGALSCDAAPGDDPSAREPFSRPRPADQRVTGLFAAARNRWRAAASVRTSQMLLALLPA